MDSKHKDFSPENVKVLQHDQMFAWKFVAHNLKKPDMTDVAKRDCERDGYSYHEIR